jgi:hypothetical protein
MSGKTQSKQLDAQESVAMLRLITAFIVLLMCIVFGALGMQKASAAPAFSYSCSNHCYGRNLWSGNTAGAETTVTVNPMGAGNGFVDNEVWVADPNSNGSEDCASGVPPCWIEAGYASVGSNNGATEYYFWAEVHPCGCGGYIEYDSGNINTNDYGGTAAISILRGGSSGCSYNNSTWCVFIYGDYDSWTGQSTDNTMHASQILIGQELAGTSGATAYTANFTFNYWVDINTGIPHFQTVDGTLDPCLYGTCWPVNPPWSGWVSGQDPRHSSYGGNFYTCSLPGKSNPC